MLISQSLFPYHSKCQRSARLSQLSPTTRWTATSLLMSTSIFPSVPLTLAFQSSLQPACLLPSACLLPGCDFADTLCPDLELACVTSEFTCISVGVLSPFIHAFCPWVFIFSRLMASFCLDIDNSTKKKKEATVFRRPCYSNTD